MRVIIATLKPRRRLAPDYPRVLAFSTKVQSEVEHAMAVFGYGVDAYTLSFGQLTEAQVVDPVPAP